jgi:hypothetical protein
VDANRSGAGTLSLSGANVYVNELNGDVFLERLFASGEAELTVAGGLYDANTGSALSEIIRRVTDAQVAADALKAAADAARALTDVLNLYIERQNTELIAQTAARDTAQTARGLASDALANAQGDLLIAQATYAALAADPTTDPDVLKAAETAMNAADKALTQAQSAFDAADETYAAAQALVDATQGEIAAAAAQIALTDAEGAELAYANAAAKLTRKRALLDAQVAVNDAQAALDEAQKNYDAAMGRRGLLSSDPALALRLGRACWTRQGTYSARRRPSTPRSDILADAAATDADKLAAGRRWQTRRSPCRSEESAGDLPQRRRKRRSAEHCGRVFDAQAICLQRRKRTRLTQARRTSPH